MIEKMRNEELNLCFEKLMMVGAAGGGGGGNFGKGVNLEGGVITEWKDIPVELLMQILSLVDDRTVMIASEVCRGWRDAICFGLTRLSLSWYMFLFFILLMLSLRLCLGNRGNKRREIRKQTENKVTVL